MGDMAVKFARIQLHRHGNGDDHLKYINGIARGKPQMLLKNGRTDNEGSVLEAITVNFSS